MFKWHNVLADRVRLEYPTWSDEDIFQRARRLVIASMQNIILYEYLPTLLGDDDKVAPYTGYKPDVHPGISHVFQSAAFRFGHTMIPPGLYRRDAKCNLNFLILFQVRANNRLPFACAQLGGTLRLPSRISVWKIYSWVLRHKSLSEKILFSAPMFEVNFISPCSLLFLFTQLMLIASCDSWVTCRLSMTINSPVHLLSAFSRLLLLSPR